MAVPLPRTPFAIGHPRRVWLVTGAHGVNEFYSVALPPVLPLIVADFDLTYGAAGGLLTVFFLTYSAFQLPAGVVADRFGQTRLIVSGMVVLSAGVLLAGVAADYATLVVAQALAGVGGSTYHPAGMSLISDIESRATEGRAMGIHAFGGMAGTALAPALIGSLAVAADWRVALLGAAAVGIGYAVVFGHYFSLSGERPPSRTDGGRPSDCGPLVRAAAAIVRVPRERWVVGLLATHFLIAITTGSARTFATSYLFERVGESTSIANAVFFVMIVGGAIASLGTGHLADRFDRRGLGASIMFASGGMLLATALVPPSPAVMLGWFFVLGMLVYAAPAAINALTSAYSAREFSGSLFAVTLTAASIGLGLGPLVVGFVAERIGMALAFPLIGVVSGLGVFGFLALYRL